MTEDRHGENASRVSSAEKPCWQRSQMLQSGLYTEGTVWGIPDFSTDSTVCLFSSLTLKKERIRLLFLGVLSDKILHVVSGTCRVRLGRTISQLCSRGTQEPGVQRLIPEKQAPQSCFSWELLSQLGLSITLTTELPGQTIHSPVAAGEANSQADWPVSCEWGDHACKGQIWSQQHLNSFLWWSGNSEKSSLLLHGLAAPPSLSPHQHRWASTDLPCHGIWYIWERETPAGRSALCFNKDAF